MHTCQHLCKDAPLQTISIHCSKVDGGKGLSSLANCDLLTIARLRQAEAT